MAAAARPATAPRGAIEVIIGPMFSGKTTEMISRATRAAYAGIRVLLVKHGDDRRYGSGDFVVTHAGLRQGSAPQSEAIAAIRVVAVHALAEVVVDAAELVIGVDEGQFYPDLVEYCERWASDGRRVIVAALDGDYARRPFGQVCNLIPLSEAVEKRRGVCMGCGCDSAFTQRISKSTALVEIGAQESYRTVCRECHAAGKL
jgi:thymidine kinase